MKKIHISEISNDLDLKEIIIHTPPHILLDIEIEYPSDFCSSRKLRDFIVTLSDHFSIPGMWKSRLTLIADELNNNGIEYGSLKDEVNIMRISISKKQDELDIILEVEDTGNGISKKKSEQMRMIQKEREGENPLQHKGIRGRGLFLIISKIVDNLYFKDSKEGGLIVGISKKIIIK